MLGGKAAGVAAITGCGMGLADRYPTEASRRERILDLESQLEFLLARGRTDAAAEVREQIREVMALT